MKKKELLTTLLLISGISITTAQNHRSLDAIPMSKKTIETTDIMNNSVSSDKMEFKNGVVSIINEQNLLKRNVKTRADEEITAMYDIPAGSLYTGVAPEGWYSFTALNTPVKCKPTFLNYSSSETQCTWTIKLGEETKTLDNVDKYGNMTCDPYFGSVETPIITAVKGSASATYQLGKASGGGVWYGGTDIIPLSGANPRDGIYREFTNGPSFTTNETFYNTGKKAVGFCTVYDQPLGLLYARSMYILVSENEPIPDGSSLKLKLAKLTEDGIGETIAEAEATSEDITPVGTNGLNRIRFTFTQKDEFGFPEAMPIKLGDSPLIALFTGFDNIKMSMRFAGANGFDGKSYMLLEDGTLATVGYGNDPETPQISFHVGFEGAFTYAEIVPGTETVKIPNAGGIGVTQVEDGQEYNDVQLLTSISWSEDNYTILSKPDWVTQLEYQDKYWENQGVMIFYVIGEALPADAKGRSGKIEIEVCGAPVTINVVQGNGTVGIQNNKNSAIADVVYDGENIHLTYPETVNNVTIYSVTGQIITNYALPANNFTISTTDLNKGVYLLKFNNNQTIKVIK